MRDKYNTYRPLAAFFFVALILQVFILKGVHHLVGHHHHEEEACNFDGAHFHAEGHGHFSCDICLFHFAPTDVQNEELTVQVPEIVLEKSSFTYHTSYFTQEIQQSFLRGPPTATA